jgi:hypothetical protein
MAAIDPNRKCDLVGRELLPGAHCQPHDLQAREAWYFSHFYGLGGGHSKIFGLQSL